MNIHQLSIAHQVEHDRILVQINTLAGEELRVWLTRRLLVNLLPHLTREVANVEVRNGQVAIADEAAKKMLVDFKKQASITQADFKTPFKAAASTFPVGSEPLLVTHVNLSPAGKENLRIGFEEKISTGATKRGFEVTMASDLLHGFMHLLELAIKNADWGILPPQNPDDSRENAADGPAPVGPVRYLN